MSDKEKKEQQLLNLLKQQVGKGRPFLENIRKIKTDPKKEELDKIFGNFICDTNAEDLINEIESSRNIVRQIENLD